MVVRKIFCLLFCLVFFVGCDSSPAWKKQQLAFVNQFFEERSKGRDVKKFFCDPDFGMMKLEDMSAPQSWVLVDDKDEDLVHKEDRNNFRFRVDSSDRNGQKVTKIWRVALQPKNEKEEHPKEWCILIIDSR